MWGIDFTHQRWISESLISPLLTQCTLLMTLFAWNIASKRQLLCLMNRLICYCIYGEQDIYMCFYNSMWSELWSFASRCVKNLWNVYKMNVWYYRPFLWHYVQPCVMVIASLTPRRNNSRLCSRHAEPLFLDFVEFHMRALLKLRRVTFWTPAGI